MPKKKYDLPKGLQNKPAGSENWYQVFYRKDRSPTIKWVRLEAHDLTGAKLERERILRTYELGLFDPWAPKEEPQARRDPRLHEAFDDYLEAHRGLAPGTLAGRRSCFRLFLKRVDPHHRRRLSQITESDIERFIEQPAHKESSRTKRLTEIGAFFRWCVEESLCEKNVAYAYKRRRRRGQSVHTRRQQHAKPRAPLMPEDLRRLLSEIQAQGRHLFLYDVVLFAVATGLRRSELCYLRRMDFHLDEPPAGQHYSVTGRVRVRSWRHPQTGEEFRTKTGKDRTIPLCPLAARLATRHLASTQTEDGYAPVFLSPRGSRIGTSQLSRHFAHYRRASGFTDRVTFHSTRHTFATWLLLLGCNIFTIKRLLGHSTLDELLTYAEMCEDFLMGDARSLQRQILFTLCPDLPDAVVERVLPRRSSLYAATGDEGFSQIQTLQTILPPEDVLFSGAGYASGHRDRSPEMEAVSLRFLETF